MAKFPTGKQQAVVHDVTPGTEVDKILKRLWESAITQHPKPLAILLITIGEWSAVVVRLKGDVWVDVARFKAYSGSVDTYTCLPDAITYAHFKTLSKWVGTGEGRKGKKMIQLVPNWEPFSIDRILVWIPRT